MRSDVLPGICLCGGVVQLSTGRGAQTLHVEAHGFLCRRRSLQNVNQHLTKLLVGATKEVSDRSRTVQVERGLNK